MWRRLWLQASSTGRKCPLRRSEFYEKNNGATVVVLAGSTQSWKPGIPAQVLEIKKLSTAIILPEDRDLHRRNVSVEETDYMWLWQMI
jgi:hypothetical protein